MIRIACGALCFPEHSGGEGRRGAALSCSSPLVPIAPCTCCERTQPRRSDPRSAQTPPSAVFRAEWLFPPAVVAQTQEQCWVPGLGLRV